MLLNDTLSGMSYLTLALSAKTEAQEIFLRQGYLILENVLDREQCELIVETLEMEWPDSHKTLRQQDIWKSGDRASAQLIHNVATLPKVEAVLTELYGREPIPFQTLNFRVGSEQAAHSDHIHFSSLPFGFMCGVWLALEKVTLENGPLFYYPGSHLLPPLDYEALGIRPDGKASFGPAYLKYENTLAPLLESIGFDKRVFQPDAGTALIWAANLVHGGSRILQAGSTRWSQVTHYLFPNCIYYRPLDSDIPSGHYFLNEIVNLKTGETVHHKRSDGSVAEFSQSENPQLFRLSRSIPI